MAPGKGVAFPRTLEGFDRGEALQPQLHGAALGQGGVVPFAGQGDIFFIKARRAVVLVKFGKQLPVFIVKTGVGLGQVGQLRQGTIPSVGQAAKPSCQRNRLGHGQLSVGVECGGCLSDEQLLLIAVQDIIISPMVLRHIGKGQGSFRLGRRGIGESGHAQRESHCQSQEDRQTSFFHSVCSFLMSCDFSQQKLSCYGKV